MGHSYTHLRQLHIGEIIENRIKEKGILRAELARKIGMPQSNLTRLLKKSSIDTGKLVEISRAVEYNFFKEFCRDDENTHLKDEDFYISEVNIGSLIDKKMKELGITQKELAFKLNNANRLFNLKQQNVSIIIKKTTIDTDLLYFISHTLEYNFFEEYFKDNRSIEDSQLEATDDLFDDYKKFMAATVLSESDESYEEKKKLLSFIIDKTFGTAFKENKKLRDQNLTLEKKNAELQQLLEKWKHLIKKKDEDDNDSQQ